MVTTGRQDSWFATKQDLEQFGLVRQMDVFNELVEVLELLGFDGEGRHSDLRYLFERYLVLNRPLDPEDRIDADVLAGVQGWLDDRRTA